MDFIIFGFLSYIILGFILIQLGLILVNPKKIKNFIKSDNFEDKDYKYIAMKLKIIGICIFIMCFFIVLSLIGFVLMNFWKI